MKPKLFLFHTNRMDLTRQAYLSVRDFFDVTIIDNSPTKELQGLSNVDVYTPVIPFNFQQAQNLILRMAQDANLPYYYWMHNDGEVTGDACRRLLARVSEVDKETNGKWGVVFTFYDIFCAFNTAALTAIGGWSPYFEQYYADVHTYRMLRLAGYDTYEAGGDGVIHHNDGSSTIRSDADRARRMSLVSQFAGAVYRAMWGGDNGSETFETPWNE
jgi:hypothetical protein